MLYLGWIVGVLAAVAVTCVVAYLVEAWEKY